MLHFLERMLHFLAGVGWMMGLIWIGLCAFSVGLLILMYTRWGQSHPLEKCLGLSFFAHLLLVGYAATISLYEPSPTPSEPAFQVSFVEGDAEQTDSLASANPAGEPAAKTEQPWEVPQLDKTAASAPAKADRPDAESPPPEPLEHPSLENSAISEITPPESDAAMLDAPLPRDTPTEAVAPPVEARPASLPQSPDTNPVADRDAPVASTKAAEDAVKAISSQKPREIPAQAEPAVEIPEMYKLRVAANRSEVAAHHGGSPETEKAVHAALRWLADNQAADGRWKAGDHGAGRDENVLGHARQNAGSKADTGVTGLALLAFLAGGNTHKQGEHQDNLRRGLEFLLRTQARDGNLGGNASTYEFMYCHAMAACALSEAFGMTREPRLREPVERAIRYSIAAQDPRGGGWRYHPGDSGDTSQLGWQLMALKSAELAGIPMPETTRRGIARFLQGVSAGTHGGLASYRAGEKVSHSMSAEALVCWQFLGISRDHPACNEAGDFLLTELPGQGGQPNDYYWYYGTLAMYQLQGDYWRQWNAALQKTLLKRQIKDGPLAGAWDTDTVWGGYGGRIYTTAIATLSLEVYYRFLPLYAE
jgi:hypothetical protein